MKNRVNIFILLIINFFYCFELNAQQYYWHNATKYEVEPIHSKSFVLIGTDSCNTKEFLTSYGMQIQHINKTKIPNGVNNSKAYHWAIANNNTQSIKALEQVLYAAPEFRAGRDTVFISNFFYVKLKRLEDVALLEKIAKETNSVIVKQNNFMPNWWIISAEGNINRNALELANEFYESGLFAAAQADFILMPTRACTNDTHFGLQWALKNTG